MSLRRTPIVAALAQLARARSLVAAAAAAAPAALRAAPAKPQTRAAGRDREALLIADLLEGEVAARRVAVTVLARVGSVRGRELVRRAVSDPVVEVAVAACEALRAAGDREAAPRLRQLVRDRSGYYAAATRAAALRALVALEGPVAFRLALDLVDAPEAEVSAAAIEALAGLRDPRALPELRGVLRNERGYFASLARCAAVEAVASFREARVELRAVAHHDPDPGVRAAAARALG